MSHPPEEEEYYAIPLQPLIVPSEGSIHNGSGFCYDPSCPCHEDATLTSELEAQRQQGLVSPGDIERIYHGKTVW